ncbi:MAG TPA: transporter substrate-binding domain-containing protein [Beutenbergiaceae bacterium]|nr:transporter substrate-binding domain-containing protein [Beutenbergiaceae bacterium]
MRITSARRRILAVSSVGLLAVGLAACSPEEEDQSAAPADGDEAPDQGSALDVEAYTQIVENGPVADDADVEANEWASGVREAGVLHVGGTETSELFSQLDTADNIARGFDAGLSQLLANYILGEANTELSQVNVDTREEVLVNNTVDVVFATYSITPERADRIDFAGPYYEIQSAILVSQDTDDINGVDDLGGRTVATQAASTGVTVLQDHAPDDVEILELPDHAQALSAVQQGRADAYVIDESLLLNAVVDNDDVKIVGEPFGPGDLYGIGLNQDGDALEFVNDWLQQVYDDGTWEELWQVTIGDRTGLEEAPEPPAIGETGLD